MDERRARRDEVVAFLRGEQARVDAVERSVRSAIRAFRFHNIDLELDLAQETLIRLLASLSDGRFQADASLCTYARNVARYVCLEHIRRKRREVAIDCGDIVAQDRWSAPERTFLETEAYRRNLEAFAALPSDCQEILRWICLEGASYREVAERLGLTESALKSRIHRCRLTCRSAAGAAARPLRLVPRKAMT